MPKQTYEVSVNANALRSIRVRAASAREAQEIAESRVRDTSGPWTIDFPGSLDEHWTVIRMSDGEIVGPYAQGDYADEPEDEGEDPY